MKKVVVFALLGVMLAAPIAALVPQDSSDNPAAELTRKKKKRAATAPAAKPGPVPTAVVTQAPPAPPLIDPQSFEGKILAAHNTERRRVGTAMLSWSPALAQQAAVWAQHLASKGLFEHSQNRGNVGENLWMGSSGYFAPEAMIGAFISERQYFRPGKFPDVSTTGKWSDVGHYTQLIWAGTQLVGCAKATGNDRDLLVCRYYPAGNVIGERVP